MEALKVVFSVAIERNASTGTEHLFLLGVSDPAW